MFKLEFSDDSDKDERRQEEKEQNKREERRVLETSVGIKSNQVAIPVADKRKQIHSLKGRPSSSTSRRNIRRREVYKEKLIIDKAVELDISNVQNQQILVAASELKAGQKRLNGLQLGKGGDLTAEEIRHVQQVHANSKLLLQSKKSNHEKQEMRFMLTKDLSSKEIADVTSLTVRSGRRIRQFNRKRSEDHAQNKGIVVVKSCKKTHRKLCDFQEHIYKQWFESSTEVRSGSSTVLRQVPASKHEFLFDLFAKFPSLLRSASKSAMGKQALHQAQQTQDKSRFQIALIFSQYSEFDVDSEYAVRFEYIKNRYRERLAKRAKSMGKTRNRLSQQAAEFANRISRLETDNLHPLKKSIKHILKLEKLEKDKFEEDFKQKKLEVRQEICEIPKNAQESIDCLWKKTPMGQRYQKELKEKKEEVRKANLEIQKIAIEPIGDVCFWNLIENKLCIHWTANVKPYNCPLCEDGPGYLIDHDKLTNEKCSITEQQILLFDEETKLNHQQRNNPTPQDVFQKKLEEIKKRKHETATRMKSVTEYQRKALKRKNKYETHLQQLEVCRPMVIKAAAELQLGECLVYRDFVNQHNEEGKKINNLVLVVLYRKEKDGDLLVFNLSNIVEFDNGGSCDAYFVADVFAFHLEKGGSDLFNLFQTIIISGDHGPHFSSAQTVFHESTFYAKYKKRIRVLNLCSYHAFNRCDAAGAAVKTLAHDKARQNLALITSSDYVFAVRDDGQRNAWSYEFVNINRSSHIFDGNGITDFLPIVNGEKLNLKEMCQLEYCFRDEHGNEAYQEGIVLARPIIGMPVSAKQEFHVLDVSKDSDDRGFCQSCSNHYQRPVYHVDKKCSNLNRKVSNEGTLFDTMNLNAVPEETRLVGIQLNKAQKAASAKSTVGIFPCRFQNCGFKFYNTAHHANRHMSGKEHVNETEEARKDKLYSKPEADQIKSTQKKPTKTDSLVANQQAQLAVEVIDVQQEEAVQVHQSDESQVSDRDSLIDSLVISHNPMTSFWPKEGKGVWKISSYCPEGVEANELNFDGQKVGIFHGVKQPRTTNTPFGCERVKYDLVDGVNPEEQICDEDRPCLFKDRQQAEQHLYKLLKDVDSEKRADIVDPALWESMEKQFKEQGAPVVIETAPYLLKRQQNINLNNFFFEGLGMTSIVPTNDIPKNNTVKRKRCDVQQGTRRSARVHNKEV